MVKEHHKAKTSSEESDEETYHQKRKKDKHSKRSRSPEYVSHHSKHHKHRHRSRSNSPHQSRHKMKIKTDPDAPLEQDHRHHRLNHERDRDRHRGHRDDDHEDRLRVGSHRPVHIKQEPRDDTDNQRQERRRNDERRRENHSQRQQQQQGANREDFGAPSTQQGEDDSAKPKDAPNFELSGKLTEDTNTYKGFVIKYNEPPEARKPKKRWRLYPFKNDEPLKPFHMHRQSAYLFGRERLIADIPVDHPSCSKQHAVFQYRLVPYEKPDGRKAHKIAPYIIDLDSANGTYINNKRMEPQRYYELFEKDVIKFGYSSRDYVLLHDKSDTTEVESENSD